MKKKVITVMQLFMILFVLCSSADDRKSSYEDMIMPEVDIRPLESQAKENFALRAQNLTVKEFLETLCFLSNRNYSFSNGVLKVNEYCRREVTVVDSTHEKDILKLADEILIPETTFRPPATIVDAVDFFYEVSQDYDAPEKLKSKSGINFAVKSPGEIKTVKEEEIKKNEPLIISDNWNSETLLKAIKRVCEKTNSRFIVYGKTIVFLPDENKK
ncbi:MAG: hypothetical protein WC328_00475 [Kiritimatiellia bacterium]|nr:hypothetical protein [Kiritimatiellia bacterium]MDD4172714.1 hypothetical protein [Kiritimatiellia bacterium]MDD4440804.1 hypothetical protein [Kiritimatiellia bacterium]MDX9792051.1 hypothetical protein [Kiritimatiellia bacterium]